MADAVLRIDIPHIDLGWAVDPFSFELAGVMDESQGHGVAIGTRLTPQIRNQIRDAIAGSQFGDLDFTRARLVVVRLDEPDYVCVNRTREI